METNHRESLLKSLTVKAICYLIYNFQNIELILLYGKLLITYLAYRNVDYRQSGPFANCFLYFLLNYVLKSEPNFSKNYQYKNSGYIIQ